MKDEFPLCTRKTGLDLARNQLGLPITKSTIDKAMWKGTGPKPVGRYGKTDLFRPSEFLEWARSLLMPTDAGYLKKNEVR